MHDEDRHKGNAFLLEAGDLFYSILPDCYGLMLLIYLSQRGGKSAMSSNLETLCNNLTDTPGLKEASDILLNDINESLECNGVSADRIMEVLSVLNNVDYDAVTDIGYILTSFVRRIRKVRRNEKKWSLDTYVLPDEVMDFIASVSDYRGGIFFTPTAAAATVSVPFGDIIPGDLFYASDEYRPAWAAGMFLLEMTSRHTKEYLFKRFMSKWPLVKPSLIVLIPKPNVTLPRFMVDADGTQVYLGEEDLSDVFLLSKSLSSVSERGKVLIVSDSRMLRCFKDPVMYDDYDPGIYVYDRLSREYLANLDQVIILPEAIDGRTGKQLIVMTFNGTAEMDSPVRMVDGTSFLESSNGKRVLKTEDLLEAIDRDYPSVVCRISKKDIMSGGFILSPVHHLSESLRLDLPQDTILLRDMVDVMKAEEMDYEMSDTIRPCSGAQLGMHGNEDGRIKAPGRIPLERDCIVVRQRGSLQPVHYTPACGKGTACDQHSVPLVVRADVDPEYLLSELNKPYVTQQVAVLQRESNSLDLNLKQLLGLRIASPDEIIKVMRKSGIDRLYHITDVANLPSIQKYGIRSRRDLEETGLSEYVSGSDRISIMMSDRMGLDHYVHFYVTGSPALYNMMKESPRGYNKIVLEISLDVMRTNGVCLSTLEPLDEKTVIYNKNDEMSSAIRSTAPSSRSGMTVLVPDIIPPGMIIGPSNLS